MGAAGARSGVGAALLSATGTAAASTLLRRFPPGGPQRWQRVNHRGARLSLTEGPAVAFGLTLAAAAGGATLTATALGAGVVGLVGTYDDLAGAAADAPTAKGFRGHLGALRRGQVTTGLLKIAGVGAAGLAAAALLRDPDDRPAAVLLDGALVAGTANLLNLFDLRPGRALKVAALLAPLAGGAQAGAVLGAVAAALPGDLAERSMLGDAGANALGAVLGLGVVAHRPASVRRAALVVVVALTAASERVSFSRVIDATPPLAALDRLGRRRLDPR